MIHDPYHKKKNQITPHNIDRLKAAAADGVVNSNWNYRIIKIKSFHQFEIQFQIQPPID